MSIVFYYANFYFILILIAIFLWFTAYNAITTAFSRYAVKVWGLQGGSFANTLLVATATAIISYIPIGIISTKIGRKKMIIIGIIIITITYCLGFFFTSFSSMIYVIFAFTGLYYTFSMDAQIFTPVFSGFLFQNISYRILFSYAFLFSCLSLCTMLLVKHGDSKL